MKHRCHATGCNTEVPPKMFMCRKHWYALPKWMRTRIWDLYRSGQEIDKEPSELYLIHARACIKYLEDHT